MSQADELTIMRVPISLPCMVPVLPGTCDTGAPIEQRTETCNVDAWWMLGRAMICTLHLRELLGSGRVDELVERGGWRLSERELLAWAAMHRYPQDPALLPEWHPVRKAAGL